jgi:hypothetical protein
VPPTHFLDRNNELDVEKAYAAIILSPGLEDAVEVLKLQGATTTVGVLEQLRGRDRERFEKRREELAPIIERRFASNLLDNAQRAVAAIGVAVERTQELLDAGKVADPSRVARDLSQVVTQSIDKRLAIQGRPTQITEHRDVGDIIRKLQSIGVIEIIDSTADDVET